MNPEEQTVTWLISLGVLSSPKKNIADPEEFLKASLKDGVVLCKLTERLIPDFTPKVRRRVHRTNGTKLTALWWRRRKRLAESDTDRNLVVPADGPAAVCVSPSRHILPPNVPLCRVLISKF